VRIIGGQWRSRQIRFPDFPGLRPTGDRLRETLFNWLAPDLEGSTCLDAFAGSGALGLEALSRGARRCLLLENHPSTLASLRANIRLLRAGAASVLPADSPAWLATKKGPYSDWQFDIVFLDPPFASAVLEQTCEVLETNDWLAVNAQIYVETAAGRQAAVPASWSLLRQKLTGDVCARLYRRQDPVAEAIE